MQNQNNDRELSWEDEINAEVEDFPVLAPDDYKFTVTLVEKARHTPQPGGKLPACPKAIVHIRIISPEGKQVCLKENLYLHTSTQGLLAAFFKSIGQRQTGQTLKMNWQTVTGSTGWCKVYNEVYKGETYNKIKKFLEPKEQNAQQTGNSPQFQQGQHTNMLPQQQNQGGF